MVSMEEPISRTLLYGLFFIFNIYFSTRFTFTLPLRGRYLASFILPYFTFVGHTITNDT